MSLINELKERAGFTEQWHLYPFYTDRVGSDGRVWAVPPRFYSNYPPGGHPDSEYGCMVRPPQADIDLVTAVVGSFDAEDVQAFLMQECGARDIQRLSWSGLISHLRRYAKPDTKPDPIVIDLSLFYGDRNKGYDFIDELRQLEGRGSIVYQTAAEAGKAALRIRKRLKEHNYIAVKIAKDGKKIKLADGVAIRFK